MNTRKHKAIYLLPIALLALLALRLLANPPPALANNPVARAWTRANASGSYQFTTNVVQTTTPLPKLINAGLSPTVEQLYVEGSTDVSNETLALNIYSEGGSPTLGSGALEMRVQDGVAQGRINGSAWQAIDDASALFAPGQDPLGFLNAARDLAPLGSGRAINGIGYERYSFEIDGPTYASYMRDQMVEELAARNELPRGVQIGLSRDLAAVVGHGEIWLDESGLPLRQIIMVTFPETALEVVSAEITTDFHDWGAVPIKTTFSFGIHDLASKLQSTALAVLPSATMVSLGALLSITLIVYASDRRVYRAVAYSFSALFLITPLLQATDAHAISESIIAFNERHATASAQPAPPTFSNGHTAAPAAEDEDSADLFFDDGTDTDGDGITDQYEIQFYATSPNDDDSDDDGLLDGVELLELGTNPLRKDSDGDLIDDPNELAGYVNSADGRTWYLDPRAQDTSGDGTPDGLDCSMDGAGVTCVDSDGDLTPDAFDMDDDDDGVPDSIDTADTVYIGDKATGLSDNEFSFDLTGIDANQSTFVDIQLRPTDPEHLWYSLSILDWPSADRRGQIQRVNDDPFGTSGTEANGDLRLTPMLQVDLAGSNVPLPLIDPQTTVALGVGTADLTQVGSNVRFDFALDTDNYDIEIIDGRCGALDESSSVLHTFDNVVNGGVVTIVGSNLVNDVATGTRALRLSNQNSSETTCHTIPNIINGAYSDKMVDAEKLDEYRTLVREVDESGNLVMLLPLALVYEQGGNVPHAFAGRLYYESDSADFGTPQTAKLIWTVSAKEDACSATPDDYDPLPSTTGEDDESAAEKRAAWCDNDANWVSAGTSIVHQYDDSWYVTGMTVQRNLGMEIAAIYQNPAYTTATYGANSFNEVPLWQLARGLDVSYMAGRSANSTTRDLTLNEVVSRWDAGSNGGSSAEARFNLPEDAFSVDRFSYTDESGLGQFTQADVYQTLDSVFTPSAINNPTVLFLRENHTRQLSIEDMFNGPTAVNNIDLPVSDAELDDTLIATMNWMPYQRQPDGWAPSTLETYWAEQGAHMTATLQSEFALDTPNREQEIAGAVLLSRIFYMSLLQGSTQLLEIAGSPSNSENLLGDEEIEFYLFENDISLDAGKATAKIAKSILALIKIAIGKNVSKEGVKGLIFPSLGGASTHKDLLKIGTTANDPGIEDPTFADVFSDAEARWATGIVKLSAIAQGLSLGSAIAGAASAALSLIAAGISFVDADTAKIVSHVSSALKVVTKALSLASAIITAKVKLATSSLKTILNNMKRASNSNIAFLMVGLAISVGFFIYEVIASGIKAGSLEFNQLFVDLIAGIIVTVLLFVIASIPIVGQLIAAIIAIIDAIIALICGLVPEENDSDAGAKARDYLCAGISGLLTKLVAWLFYDQAPLVGLDNENRLNLTNFEFGLVDPDLGYQEGNALQVELDIETALYMPEFDTEDLSPFSVYRWMFNDSNLKKTTLTYQFSTENEVEMETGDMSDAWQPIPAPPPSEFFASDANFYTVAHVGPTDFTLAAGVNRASNVTVVERQWFKVQECSIPLLCWLRNDDDSQDIDLNDYFTYDVFPATLNEFRALTQVGVEQYRLAWDDEFPVLQDADGDGLRNATFGGADPDDRRPDTDFDGLSDFYELNSTNTDPANNDTDGDGLCDGQEVLFFTDPNRADTDADGLLDGEEVYHQDLCDVDDDADTDEWVGGWQFVYAYDGTVPLRTLVTSDPNSADLDEDLYPDVLEKLYGFNPNVPSSGDILNIDSTVSDNIVKPGDTIDYKVELENVLDTSFALGLLDVEFNADVQDETVAPQPFNVRPKETETSSGQVTISSAIAQSQIVSMTNVAGASILNPLNEVDGRSLWLKFEEGAGATSFTDSSLDAFTFSCSGICPASGVNGYRGNAINGQGAQLTGATAGLLGIDSSGFTIDTWVRRQSGQTANVWQFGRMQLQITAGDKLQLVDLADNSVIGPDFLGGVPENRWVRVTVRYLKGSIGIFYNGLGPFDEVVDLTTLLEDAADVEFAVSASTGTRVDDLSVYPFALTDSQVASLANERVLYISSENLPANSNFAVGFDDTSFQNPITCHLEPGTDCPHEIADGYIGSGGQSAPNNINDAAALLVGPAQNLDLTINQRRFTIAAWVDPDDDSAQSTGPLFGGNGYPTLWVQHRNTADGQTLDLEVRMGNSGGIICSYKHNGRPIHRDWNQVVLTFDGNKFELFLNGEEINGFHVVNGALKPDCDGVQPISAESFYIGNLSPASSSMFQGRFDELQIFNHVRTPEQVDDTFWQETPLLNLRLDDPPTTTSFEDRSIFDHDVTCSGSRCPLAGLPGRDNQALTFDGIDDELELPTVAELDMNSSDFSVAGWVSLDNIGFGSVIKTRGSNALFLGSGGGTNGQGIPLAIVNGTTLEGAAPMTANQWTHLALVYDSAETGTLTLFVDGTATVSETNLSPNLNGATTLVAGTYLNEGTLPPMSGQLDRLQVFRDALSAAEVQELTRQVPVLNLHLNEAYGTVALENTGSAGIVPLCSNCGLGVNGRMYGGATFSAEPNQGIAALSGVAGLLSLDRYSVGLWVRPTQKRSDWQSLISKETTNGNDRNFGLHILPNTMQVNASLQLDDCSTFVATASNAELLENSWNHVLLTYDGAELKLYVNGSLDNSVAAASVCQEERPVLIGYDTQGSRLVGQLDEVVVYPSVLSEDDIRELYGYQIGWYDVAVEQRIVIDADMPLVQIAVPTTYVRNLDRIVPIVVTDASSDIVSVEYQVNGGAWLPASADIETWLFNFQPNGNGPYSINARATDEAGNVGNQLGKIIHVDGTGIVLNPLNIEGVPALPVIYDEMNIVWRLPISGTVSAATFLEPVRLASGELAILNAAGETLSGWLPITVTGDSWRIDYPLNFRPNGSYTVTVNVLDSIGNPSSRTVIAHIDATAPDATFALAASNIMTIGVGSQLAGTVLETGSIKSGVAGLDVSFHEISALDESGVTYVPSGNVAHLRLDEVVDPTARGMVNFADSSASALASNCSNCPATLNGGNIGAAPSFDGSNDAISISDMGTELSSGAFSFGAWIKPASGVGNAGFLTLNSGANSYALRYDEVGGGRIQSSYAGNVVQSNNPFGLDQWHFVIVVADPSVGGRLYVNGMQQTVFSVPTTPAANSSLSIGQGAGTFFKGQIDDVIVYDRALTSSEVGTLTRAGFSGIHLTFDDVATATDGKLANSSRNGRGATFTGLTTQPVSGAVGAAAMQTNGSGVISIAPFGIADLRSGPFTQMAWVYPEGNGPIIDSTRFTNSAYPFITIVDDTKLEVGFGTGFSQPTFQSGSVLTQQAWNFVASTFDGSTYRIYVNGSEVASTSAFDGLTPVPAAGFVELGGFNGAIDEVEIYRQVLSAEQIAQAYAKRWQPATLSNISRADSADWAITVPLLPSSVYEVRLRTHDNNDNTSFDYRDLPYWTGAIDASTPLAVDAVTIDLERPTNLMIWAVLVLSLATAWVCYEAWSRTGIRKSRS